MGLLFAYSNLPPLKFSEEMPISLKEFYTLLELNLSKSDKEKIVAFRRLIDIKNILSFQTGVMFDAKGNFLEAGLRLALTEEENLPEYILDFLSAHANDADLVKAFPELYALFFQVECAKSSIVAEFLSFERRLNLVLMAYNAKKQGESIDEFLKYEDETDSLLGMLAVQSKGTGPFVFPYEFKDLESKVVSSGSDPMEQYLAVASYRFSFYEEVVNNTTGSIKAMCGYMMCLWILSEKEALKEKKGKEILTELVESGYE